jgi:hypothetical protein
MDLYLKQHPDDPEWLAKAGLFHGHLGPWMVAGAMIGHDAIVRLETPGQWKIDITCWMPADKQRTPFSCILDGLQVSTGATLGKQNIRFAPLSEAPGSNWPIMHVVRLEDKQQPLAGLIYRATNAFHDFLRRSTPERLEDASRELAREEVTQIFDIAPMSEVELAPRKRTA